MTTKRTAAMRHLRHSVLAALAVALCAAPLASAHDRHESGDGAVIAPARGGGLSGGALLGEAWAREVWAGEDPARGSCVTLARNVLAPHVGDDLTATCSATPRERLFVYFGTACFNVEEGVGETEEEQLACAVAYDQPIRELNVTVDKGDSINIVRRRFELESPQRTVVLPEGNVFGVPAQTATFTAHGWGAVIRRLRPGRHTVTLGVVAPDFGEPFTFKILLNVARGGHHPDGSYN